MLPPAVAPMRPLVWRWNKGKREDLQEIASREERVHIEYAGGGTSLWACPVDLESLALGHVLLDCLHKGPEDAPNPQGLPRGVVTVLPAAEGEHILRVELQKSPLRPMNELNPGQAEASILCAHMQAMLELPGLWDGTGCFHRAAMLHLPSGRFRAVSEDIGRHNCLDRLAGIASMQGLDPAEHVLCITARITASLYAKARRAGFAFMLSRAAVTSASLQSALAQGVTLVGYCRSSEERCTIFADTQGRVQHVPKQESTL